MWAQIIAAIGGAIIGGVANGVSTAKAIDAATRRRLREHGCVMPDMPLNSFQALSTFLCPVL